ncbi:MAG: glycosyltransferase family 39 protein [Gammaproteobacteria bacterium]|nr:glycosyltransferase family 39 protein [Gammaproteobacteria bacterium]
MSWKDRLTAFFTAPAINFFDFLVIAFLLFGGMYYLHDYLYWGVGWVGESQYGDAEFWWNGAVQVAEGIFKDNPGKGFRPGYFILTGFTLPVIGMLFQQFYTYFLIAFLTTASIFYLSLRPLLGRWVAACVVGMLIFNPFTAEWVATSTTDSTGLMLNLAALSCLLFGVNNKLKRSWLIAFGLFFAMATLTRPLMTPFIGIVLLALLALPKEPFKKRLGIMVCVLLAFTAPTLLWMTTQKLIINQWSLSSNDASAFYAASDPAIQVWNPTMYGHIQEIAAKRNNISLTDVDEKLTNRTFWQETIKNYQLYSQYHFKRAAPHVWEIARFSPKISVHGTDTWRTALFILITAGLSLFFLFKKRWFRSLLCIGFGIAIYQYTPLLLYMTLIGGTLALLSGRRAEKLGIFFLSAYWFTGVFALYLVGGTWGTPSFTALFDLNALGYRLGTQFFFVGDLLAAYCLVWLAYFKFKLTPQLELSNIKKLCQNLFCKPSPIAGIAVMGYIGSVLTATTVIYFVGGYVAIQRAYVRTHAEATLFPTLEPINNLYKQRAGHNVALGISKQGALTNLVPNKADFIFTGTISPFIWNLSGQERVQLKVYAQNKMHPITMGPSSIYLDIPKHIQIKDWAGHRGAFIVRQITDQHNVSNLPYYLTNPEIIAFFPLASDEKSYDLSKAIWFPLVKNATQLASDGHLQSGNNKINWSQDSGSAHFQRRFYLTPQVHNKKILLSLNTKTAIGTSELSFSYALAKPSSENKSSLADKYYDVEITAISNKNPTQRRVILKAHNPVATKDKDDSINRVNFTLPPHTQNVEITFDNLLPKTDIWFYEFNLSANDFVLATTRKN